MRNTSPPQEQGPDAREFQFHSPAQVSKKDTRRRNGSQVDKEGVREGVHLGCIRTDEYGNCIVGAKIMKGLAMDS